jgi:hypothetical protein
MLSQAKRHEPVALRGAGHSRRSAVQIVGCARSTLYWIEARDPEFAQCVAYDTAQLEDEPRLAPVELGVESAESPIERTEGQRLRHSSKELPSYVRRPCCKYFSGQEFSSARCSNFLGHTRSRLAHESKRTAHGGTGQHALLREGPRGSANTPRQRRRLRGPLPERGA